MATDYVQLKHYSKDGVIPVTSIEENIVHENGSDALPPTQGACGQPHIKRLCDWIDSLTLTCSFVCLTICTVVVTPSLPYAWRLGYNNQLIVLGFMLAAMNLCSRRITTRLFTIVEVRWGSSTLQNFDAIMRQSIFVPQTSAYWVLIFLILTALPLALSVAYKSFIGGSASQTSSDILIKQYGMFSRPYAQDQKVVANAARESMLSFFNAAFSDEYGPTYAKKPQPFGFNQLLISNTTSAVLDMPNSTVLATVQKGLNLGESLTISADVKGTVAVYNTSTATLLLDEELWSELWELHTLETYHAYRMGISFSRYDLDAFVWLGGYLQTCGVLPAPYLCNYWYEHYNNVNASDVEAFRASNMTLLFNIYRQPCSAVWNVTASDVLLLSGNCTDVRDPNRIQNLDGNMMPLISDLMDVIAAALYPFIPYRPTSAWRIPSYAMLSAISYWSRWSTYGIATALGHPDLNLTQEFVYNITDEKVVSTRLTLAARPWLYIVLAIQPVLTALFLVLSICLYSTPVDSSFGLTSILASIREDNLDYLRGAGLSGQLTRRLHLNIAVEQPAETEQGYVDGVVQSRIGFFKDWRRTKVMPGKMYG